MDQFIKNLAKGAGAILREGFCKEMQIKTKKGTWDILTKYDLASEKYLMDKIKARFPKHGILAEESGEHPGHPATKEFWIIDPLDGTRAFSRGNPQFCVIIAFVKNNAVEYGAIYDPMQDELFFAARSKGAFLNGKKIKIVEPAKFQFSWIEWGYYPPMTDVALTAKVNKMIFKNDLWVNTLPASGIALAYTAAGRFDAILSQNAFPWDYAAGSLLLKEAGSKVTDHEGKPYRWDSKGILAASPKIHAKILRELR